MRARSALPVALLLLVSCGAQEWEVRGVVRDVLPESGQVVIEHEEIPRLMSAMTMSFDVPDRAVLDRFEKGMVISFTLRRAGHSFHVVGFEVLDVDADAAGAARARLVGVRDPAPGFDLLDQDRRPLRLEELRGKAVILDFVFTHCSGPCPILTSSHVTLQRSLPEATRERVRFVSITLDPARDTPEALRAYALARNADLSGWSFLTGPVETVDAVVRAYGVGKAMDEEGEIEHTVATFLIDPDGRIAKRYLGLEHDPREQRLDLESVL